MKETNLIDLRIKAVRISDDTISADLVDGRTIAVPLVWSRRLAEATPEQRQRFQLSPAGYGIHWPDVDEDLNAEFLLYGPSESMAEQARREARFRISKEEFAARAKKIDWLLFDVDGVLSDGTLLYTADGEEIKQFNVKDGLGFRLAQRAGLKLGLLSGRRSAPLERRAKDLDFDVVMLGRGDKIPALETFFDEQSTDADHVAYIGDDLPDIPVLRRCALSFAPADAAAEVRKAVDVTLDAPGGRGAAREMVERVLKARGGWAEILEKYSSDIAG